MGTFSRIRYVIAANVNALLEKAEDPEKLLRALIREMEDAGEDARLAAADLLAEQQHLERVAKRLDKEHAEWQERAEKAVEAGRDDLARAAIKARTESKERLEATHQEQESLRQRLLSAPHSPMYLRVNGMARNMDEFYEAFDVKEGDKMWIAPEDRVRIW